MTSTASVSWSADGDWRMNRLERKKVICEVCAGNTASRKYTIPIRVPNNDTDTVTVECCQRCGMAIGWILRTLKLEHSRKLTR